MKRVLILSAAVVAILAIGCQRNEPSAGASVQPWKKATKIESTWGEPGVAVITRFSSSWTLPKAGSPDASINIQGEVAFTYRDGKPEATRGIPIFIHPSKDYSDFGVGYIDLDELPAFVQCIEKFAQNKDLLAIRDSSMVGVSFKTRGGVFFRTGSLGSGYVIGAWKDGSQNQETAVSGLTDADLSEFKMKLELARQWAEKQTP